MKSWLNEKIGNYYVGCGVPDGVQLTEGTIAVVNHWPGAWWIKRNPNDPEPLAEFCTKEDAIKYCKEAK